ncbi:hypothetical protein QE410_000563 [Microbacterium sp. SORGH_AS 1204]|nr:hypothetical protein [Microbacterium sp. SORGH_AS_1204]
MTMRELSSDNASRVFRMKNQVPPDRPTDTDITGAIQ